MKILHVLTCRRLPLDEIAAAVDFYEKLFGEPRRLEVTPVKDLRIVQIGSVLLMGAGSELLPNLPPVEAAYLVEGLADFARALPDAGCEVVQPPTPIATGRNMLVKHPDGALVEYVEHSAKNPADNLLAARPALSTAS